MKKFFLVALSALFFSSTIIAHEHVVVSSTENDSTEPNLVNGEIALESDFANMPRIVVQDLSGGERQISITTRNTEENTSQSYIVRVDRQGNRETLIKTVDPKGMETVSAVGKDTQVPVMSTPEVIIEDGILVDAAAKPETKLIPENE